MRVLAGALVAALVSASPLAQDRAQIEVVPVRANVFMLAGAGGNVTVQVGSQGVLVVDTMTGAVAPQLVAEIEKLAAGRPIRYVLNTSADADHTGGNLAVAEAGSQLIAGNFLAQLGTRGAQSAFIVAHENVLKAMSAPRAGAAAVPFGALPTDTFFQQRKDMFFNGEAVQLVHLPGAHGDGDALVFFRRSDVISAGDLYANDVYPRIDAQGHVNGVIEGLNTLIDLMVSEQFTEGGTLVVPGHGRIGDEMDVVEYRDMVTIVRDRVKRAVDRGMTLAQVQASRPTLEFDGRYGAAAGPATPAAFVETVYRNLSQRPAAAAGR